MLWGTVLKVLEPGMELLLSRLGDRGYASPREQVREVVDVGAGQPAVPGLPGPASAGSGAASGRSPWSACESPWAARPRARGTRPTGYVTASSQALGASWLPIDWNAIRLPTGITAPRWNSGGSSVQRRSLRAAPRRPPKHLKPG